MTDPQKPLPLAGEVETRSGEGEGDRVASQHLQPARRPDHPHPRHTASSTSPTRSAGELRKVAVLYGGVSAEREVSLATGVQVIAALREANFDVTPIEVGNDLTAVIAALTPRPDAVFNALHGRLGEDGAIQGVLDWLGIPYTHSGVRASALAMDKVAAKAVFVANGLPVARHRVVPIAELAAADPIPLPYVVKPVNEGSSVGVEIIRTGDNRRAEVARAWRFGSVAMVEEYIAGRELTVGVMGDRALGVTEIIAEAGVFYDYESKYADGGSRHIIPAAVHPDIYARALDVASAAHRALGCRGATRCDFRYDDTAGEPGRLVLLEINTQPGLTHTSLLPEQAAFVGIDFKQLCVWMVENAACRA
jgi:D-alanine-D-alanine ligase